MKIALIRLSFWKWVATRLAYASSDPFSRANPKWLINRIESAYHDAINSRRRRWIICPERGGSNLEVYTYRDKALNFVAGLGAIRYVDDVNGVIIYNPKETKND